MRIAFTFQSTTLILLFVNVLVVGLMTSLVLFAILNQQQQQQMLQQKSQQEGNRIIAEIFNKLDALHVQSNQLVNAQGNITQSQRAVLIKEFTDVGSQGGLATKLGQANNNHMLKEILGNVTSTQKK